jgi:hypothetical protein
MATCLMLKAINARPRRIHRSAGEGRRVLLFPIRRGRGLAGSNRGRADGQQAHAKGVDRGIPPAEEAERQITGKPPRDPAARRGYRPSG